MTGAHGTVADTSGYVSGTVTRTGWVVGVVHQSHATGRLRTDTTTGSLRADTLTGKLRTLTTTGSLR